jgi:hypothetical protein
MREKPEADFRCADDPYREVGMDQPHLRNRPYGLEQSAPEPCSDITVEELLEWLHQPQYTDGYLDHDHARHMAAAATLIEHNLRRTPVNGERTMPTALCELCGEPMPLGEEMFKYHGLTGPCPKEVTRERVSPMSIPAELRNARMMVNRGHGDVSDEPDPLHEAAADEIERLQTLLRRARQALRSLDEISDEEIDALVCELDDQHDRDAVA